MGIADAVNLLDNKNDNDNLLFFEYLFAIGTKYFYLIVLCNMPQYKNHYMEESY